MIQSNKMIYQQPKYHSNSFTHFLQLHSSINNNNNSININGGSNINSHSANRIPDESLGDENVKLDIHDHNSNTSNTSLEVVNDSIGKSFTIAAILGLKKNSVDQLNRQHCGVDLDESGNDYNSEFSSIINLTAHSKVLFQKFDNDNRHNYMHTTTSTTQQQQQSDQQQQPQHHHHQHHHSQMPIEQCIYDNNTSNSSYQEQLHKHLNPEFNAANYSRNIDQSNPALRSHLIHQHQQQQQQQQQQHSAASNMISKAFSRDRSRLGLLLVLDIVN